MAVVDVVFGTVAMAALVVLFIGGGGVGGAKDGMVAMGEGGLITVASTCTDAGE